MLIELGYHDTVTVLVPSCHVYFDLANAIDYSSTLMAFTRFLDDRRICLRATLRSALCAFAQNRSWVPATAASFDRGGQRVAAMYTLIATAKLNGVDS
jgi:transposase